MITTISLRSRLLLAFGVILLLALSLPAYYLNFKLEQTIDDEARAAVARDLHAVDWIITAEKTAPVEKIDEILRTLAAKLEVRVTYIDRSGNVLMDSAMPPEKARDLENHLGRPEVIEALKGTMGTSLRYSDTLAQDLLYAAQLSNGQANLAPGIVRIAKPQTAVRRSLDHLYSRVGAVYAVSLVLAVLLVSLALRQVSRSIDILAQAAAGVGDGTAGKRIRISPSKELTPLVVAFNNMAERIEGNIQTITKQKMESEAVLNGMRAGVIVLDGRGHILRGNYAAQEVFPGLSTYAGRKPMEMSLIRELQDGCDTALRNRKGGDYSQINLSITLQGGRIFDVSIVPVKGDADLGAIMVFHDITAIKQVEQIRRDFVANVSHELRTPLTSIKGYAETLLGVDICDAEQAKSFLQVILRNANHMNTMLDELLQLSKLEHGKLRVDMVAVEPASALYSAWKSCQPLAKKIQYVNEVAENTPAVRGNFEQIVQVFRNVLENAIKYVPADTAVIRVHAQQEGRALQICIEDNGPGVPAEDQSRIFERFYRVEKDRNSSVEGTGLGLAICRHIVVNHQGKITVQSPVPETGTGSRFIITLPLAGQAAEDNS